ncbi:M14 family zinc carboxypeptidase [Dokdonia sp. Hel_I_53]|uniref:M14 family zinc carboxypeptidase n=1 Tax=Dokdonia sp. Hel_I_53 TaxID=1566287 RepID=UPI00119C61E5|nr:M14 family zinc carboxypeptidase [Dokdonia sp. Hel_I_53]TVZ51449.1 putative secreted protein (Por secretion system target) [Dokdonia sp. Hel_I_53]
MKSSLLVVMILLASFFANAQQQNINYKRAKIYLDAEHTLKQLNNLDIPADHGIHKDGKFIISDFSTDEIDRAVSKGYKISIINEDIKAYYKNQINEQHSSNNISCTTTDDFSYTTPENFNQGSMGGYFTYQELLNELDDMATQFPNLITPKTQISNFLTEGTSNTDVSPSIGNNPIYWVRISDNPSSDEDESEILYTSIHHAREPMSLMNLVFYMWYLLENYETDSAIKALVDNSELYFIPVVNPDGYLYNEITDPNGGGLWRKNRNNTTGVDNNRNYDYHINGDETNGSWGGSGSSNNPSSDTYHGTEPFSEIENKAVKWFVEQHEFTVALNNHTFGEILYYPFGYADVPTSDDSLYQGLGSLLTSKNNYDAFRDYPYAGDSDDFMYGTVGTHEKIFAFTPEIGTSFWPPASDIIDTCKKMMYLNLTAARVIQNYASVEDTSTTFISSTNTTANFLLQRLGIKGTGDFTVTFIPVSNNIVDHSESITFVQLEQFEEVTQSIDYSLDTGISNGDPIIYDLVVENGIYNLSKRITKIYGETEQLFLDEGNSTTENFENNNWETTTSTFVSASSSITDSADGDYQNGTNSSIELSNGIDLSNAVAASMNFYTKWDIEDTWDYVQLEVSIDNRQTWEAQCGKYTTAGTNNQPIGEPLYDGVQEDWTFEEVDLSDYIGESILIRFKLVTDSGVTRDGFYFDDLSFNIINNDNLSVDDSAFAKAFSISPNPTLGKIEILSSIDNYHIEVVDIAGRKLFNKKINSKKIFVDLSSYASGIYFIRLQKEQNIESFKILKL